MQWNQVFFSQANFISLSGYFCLLLPNVASSVVAWDTWYFGVCLSIRKCVLSAYKPNLSVQGVEFRFKKPDVSYITPQTILTEFQVSNVLHVRAKAGNNSEFSVVTEQIEFSTAHVQLTRSVYAENLSDCKSSRFPKAGSRTDIRMWYHPSG